MKLRPRFPQSLAGRFALLLVLALLAANVAAVLLLTADRARTERAINEARDFDHVMEVVATIGAAEPSERAALAGDVSNPFMQVRVGDRPAVRRTPPRYRALAERLNAAADGRAEVHVASRPTRDWRRGGRGHRRGDDADDGKRRWGGGERPPQPRGGSLWVSVTLSDDQYANIVLGPLGPIPRAPFAAPLILIVSLSLLAVLGVGLLFVRRLTRPIRSLAQAAGRAGRGDYSTHVPEKGARELREMAAAFNDMQTKIARFDQDRMRLIAAVGHDLRTPITSLRIRAEMLDEEMREAMVRTLDEMHVMADGLLAFAKGEAAEASEVLDLAALCARVCTDAGAPFEAKARLQVLGRPVALTRMLTNLLTNAERYAGGASVTLSASGGRAVVAVADEGPGIPAERLEDMMQPFTRLDPSRSSETGGAGLGLSIARSVARAHGGELTLANRSTGGLVATVELPLADPVR